tara:strand:- start:715 stop:990 length:276 start_codon:yes stop_codon:yes gene_type:complete
LSHGVTVAQLVLVQLVKVRILMRLQIKIMKKFLEFALIWYSQQMAIPFWIIGHVHLSLNVYQDIHEILASLGLNILVAIGFIIDYRKNGGK